MVLKNKILRRAIYRISFFFICSSILFSALLFTALDGHAANKGLRKTTKSTASYSEFFIASDNCPLKIYFKKRWIKSKTTLPKGEKVYGIRSDKIPNELLFRTSRGKTFRGNLSCLNEKEEGFFERTFSGFSPYMFAGFSSWQDEMSVADQSSGLESPLRVNNAALCLGLGVTMTRSWYSLAFDSCAFYGKAHSSNSEEVPLITYSARNADIFGAQNTAHILWLPPSGNVEFGLALPLYIKSGVWPVTSDNSDVNPKLRLLWGGLLEARFIRGKFVFTQDVGFLGNFKNFIWNIQGAWYF